MKVRRRAAARNLLRSPDATPKQKRHLVDGVWVDKLPFSARDAWLAEQAEKARFKAEVEAWEAQQAESASLVKAEPVLHITILGPYSHDRPFSPSLPAELGFQIIKA